MRTMIRGLLVVGALTWMGAAYASDDTSKPLDNDRINIRSVLDPTVTIAKDQPVSVMLPTDATIEDKQLLELIKNNLIAEGYTVTSPDKSAWTLIASVRDQSSLLTYYKNGIFSPSTITATMEYTTITVVICPNSDLSKPVWMSSVYSLTDFWINHQEKIVTAILSTYGANFYYRNEEPKDIPDDVRRNSDQPEVPTLEQLKRCVANPKADDC